MTSICEVRLVAGGEILPGPGAMTIEEIKQLVQADLQGATVTEVEDFDDACAVYFVNDEYLESGDILDLQVGAGPAIYIKKTGEMFQTGSGRTAENYIEAYRQSGDVYGEPGNTLLLTGFAPDVMNSKQAILHLKAIAGLTLTEAKRLIEKMENDGRIEVSLDTDRSASAAAEKLTRLGFRAKQVWQKPDSFQPADDVQG